MMKSMIVALVSLEQIINKPLTKEKTTKNDSNETPDRFNSVINFSNFLLHVLRVLTEEDGCVR